MLTTVLAALARAALTVLTTFAREVLTVVTAGALNTSLTTCLTVTVTVFLRQFAVAAANTIFCRKLAGLAGSGWAVTIVSVPPTDTAGHSRSRLPSE